MYIHTVLLASLFHYPLHTSSMFSWIRRLFCRTMIDPAQRLRNCSAALQRRLYALELFLFSNPLGWDLLETQWVLHRVVAIVGAADVFKDFREEEIMIQAQMGYLMLSKRGGRRRREGLTINRFYLNYAQWDTKPRYSSIRLSHSKKSNGSSSIVHTYFELCTSLAASPAAEYAQDRKAQVFSG